MRTINDQVKHLFLNGAVLDQKLVNSYEKKLIKAYRESLKEIQSQIADMYGKFGDDVSYADMVKYKRLANLEKQIAQILKRLTRQSVASIRGSIEDQYSQAFYYTGYVTETTLQTKLGFGLLSEAQVEAAIINPLDRIKWQKRTATATTILERQLRQTLAQGLIQGQGFRKTAKQLRERMEKNVGNNILRIVRTETHRAQSAGRIAAFEKSEAAAESLGINVNRQWVSTLDTRTRDEHRSIDGQLADDENQFRFSDGVETEGPGLSGVAEHDINCRCTTILQFEDIPHEVRRDNEARENIPYKSYDEWYKNRIAG